MSKKLSSSRRKFLQQLGSTTLLLGTGGLGQLSTAAVNTGKRLLPGKKEIVNCLFKQFKYAAKF